MSSKGAYPFHGCKSPGATLVCGSFVTAGAGAPTGVTGAGFSVSAPASGVYTITLTDGGFPAVLSGWVNLGDGTVNANDTVRFGDVATAIQSGTFTIITASAAGTDADLTGPRVHFGLFLRNTSVTR